MRAPRSLRARVVLAAVAAISISGIIAGSLLVAAIERDGRNAVDRSLRQRIEDVGTPRGPGFGGRFGPPPGGDPGVRLLAGTGTFAQVALNGQVVVQRGDVPTGAPAVPATDGYKTIDIDGRQWRSLTVTASPDGDLRLQVLESLAPVEARVARTRTLVILIGLGALALTALAAWAFTTYALRPLARLRAGAARVRDADDLSTALPEDDGPDEVRSLARTLNDMLARLQESSAAMQRALDATRRFAGDAGHELRTPLTGMRANLDSLDRNPDLPPEQRQALVREIAAEQERIVHLIEGLQALARGDAADSLPREDVELADLVDAAVYSARRRHPATSFELEEDVGDATVRGWANGLRLVVDNLLDNAALHGRAGGRVHTRLQLDGTSAILRVDDDGPGIPPADRERLLQPFARGATTSRGTGLGLAIVSQQVGLHRGLMTLSESRLGGLQVEIRLPIVPRGEGSTLTAIPTTSASAPAS
jgi:signal transduction histidine kinase